METTLTCAFAQWSPGLGDNHVMGWVTVVVYLAAGLVSLRTARALVGPDPITRRERLFWSIAAGVMLFLAVNKQLDLQSLITMIGRCHARLAGWYDIRHLVQQEFILAVAVGGVAGLALLAWLLRGILGRVWLALLGLGFVCGFVVIRAASFHHVDVLISTRVAGLKMNWILELPGPLLVAAVATWRRRNARPKG